MIRCNEITKEILSYADPAAAAHAQKFFKTGKGEYGEGDIFIGLTSPQVRGIVKKYYKEVDLEDLEKLLHDPRHEMRSVALLIMVERFEKGMGKEEIFDLYIKNVKYINNWDLVDISCYKIAGRKCFEDKNYEVLDRLASSNHLWSERIAVVSNMYLLKRGDFTKVKEYAVKFLNHEHDLMHKAIGWMLREMGKMDEKELVDFLDKYSKKLPRTALRYAIEKLTPEQRKLYMAK